MQGFIFEQNFGARWRFRSTFVLYTAVYGADHQIWCSVQLFKGGMVVHIMLAEFWASLRVGSAVRHPFGEKEGLIQADSNANNR
jgi:hypothetical protein